MCTTSSQYTCLQNKILGNRNFEVDRNKIKSSCDMDGFPKDGDRQRYKNYVVKERVN